jgi:hypothetical protein
VYLRGLLTGSTTAGQSLESASLRAAELAERTRAWQPQLSTALKLPAEGQVPRAEQIAALLDQHEYLRADLGADSGAALMATIRSIAGAPARTLIGLAAPRGAAASAGARAQALQREGFPNLGVFGADLDSSVDEFAELRRSLSLRAQPAIAGRRGS